MNPSTLQPKPTVFLTGVSSFTGCWFAHLLLAAGFKVVGTYTRSGPEAYSGIEAQRVNLVRDRIDPVWSAPFGSDRMLEALENTGAAVLGLHGAQVGDHRAPDFDVLGSARATTEGLGNVLEIFRKTGGQGVIHTASYFEADTGKGDEPREAFSPYALCKTLTWHMVRYEIIRRRIPLVRFVIPNPFGPLDKPGFTNYLLRTWSENKPAEVRTPLYERDNIPVSLLAAEYVNACRILLEKTVSGLEILEPSGFRETQGAFAERFAGELRSRTGWDCALIMNQKTEWNEPRVRQNRGTNQTVQWDESVFWDAMAKEALHLKENRV
ncbi:MAG: NAD-dependent epimerase/dehydratase family protein [Kiritimatiellia bacterium]